MDDEIKVTVHNIDSDSDISISGPDNDIGTNTFMVGLPLLTHYLRASLDERLDREMMEIVIDQSLSEYQMNKKDQEIDIRSQLYKDISSEMKKCTICQTKFIADDLIAILECKHVSHANCLREWGKYKPECPICRKEIPIKK